MARVRVLVARCASLPHTDADPEAWVRRAVGDPKTWAQDVAVLHFTDSICDRGAPAAEGATVRPFACEVLFGPGVVVVSETFSEIFSSSSLVIVPETVPAWVITAFGSFVDVFGLPALSSAPIGDCEPIMTNNKPADRRTFMGGSPNGKRRGQPPTHLKATHVPDEKFWISAWNRGSPPRTRASEEKVINVRADGMIEVQSAASSSDPIVRSIVRPSNRNLFRRVPRVMPRISAARSWLPPVRCSTLVNN